MNKSMLAVVTLFCAVTLFLSACQDNVSPNIEDSLDLFSGLEAIPEASQTAVTIHQGSDPAMDGYFNIMVDGVETNPFLSPGTYQAWCLEWNKNLRSNGDEHADVSWYNTASSTTWKPMNYLLSITDDLKADDPELTYRDIQAVIWVIAGEMGIAPEFDVMNLPVNRIPSRLRSGDELAFSREKAAAIASKVIQEAPEAVIPTHGIVAQTASDEQDIIVIPPTPGLTADLVTAWDTRLAPGTKIILPLGGIKGTATIDWGDGTVEEFNGTSAPVHQYEKDGIYTVYFSGKAISFNSRDLAPENSTEMLIRVGQWGTLEYESMEGAFYGAKNLELVPEKTDYEDDLIDGLENVTDMSYMFSGAESFDLSLDDWDFSSVTNMEGMLQNASSFNQAITWNTPSVTNISYMFSGATSFDSKILLNTSSVTDISYMFAEAINFNQSVEDFDTREVQKMEGVFENALSFNQPLNRWKTDNVTTMSKLFAGAEAFNQPMDDWNTGRVEDMSGMFTDALDFNQAIGNWETKFVRTMANMFLGATSFDQPLNSWDTGSVTDMSGMFADAIRFNQPLDRWITIDVKTMEGMFSDALLFDQPIDNWETAQVENMASMFAGAESFNQPLNGWDVRMVKDMSFMFSEAFAFDQPLDRWETVSLQKMAGMFEEAISFNQEIGGWPTKNVTDMAGVFLGARSFNKPLLGWDTSNVETMSAMFKDAFEFDQSIGGWTVDNVTDMSEMFQGAALFNQDINNWNTGKVTTMQGMFNEAGVFNQPIGNWNTENVTNMVQMFRGAVFFNQDLSGWNVSNLNSCPDKPFESDLGASFWTAAKPIWGECKFK